MNPNCLSFSERERERAGERERGESPSSVVNGVVGYCDGAG